MATLTVDGATVRIGRTDILADVTVAFAAGLVTVVIGPNGAGKSTLLSVAAGERTPTSGRVTIDGRDLARISVKQRARQRAVMPQDTTVAFPFTVREVVAMGRTAWDSPAAVDDAIVDDVLEHTGLTGFADRTVTTLSGGEHQLVAFARVIAQATPVGPNSVILLDEPTAAMDIAHAETTLRAARELAADGAAVGMVLHDLDAAAAYADELVLMSDGRVQRTGTVADVCESALLSDAYGTRIDVFDHGGRLHVGPRREIARVGDR